MLHDILIRSEVNAHVHDVAFKGADEILYVLGTGTTPSVDSLIVVGNADNVALGTILDGLNHFQLGP
jgi:hypothetical protein